MAALPVIDQLILVTQTMLKHKDEMREKFCSENPICKAKCGCFVNGQYDDSKCPLFRQDNAGIDDELRTEYNTQVLLGNITPE